jgi:hypothetical protein
MMWYVYKERLIQSPHYGMSLFARDALASLGQNDIMFLILNAHRL